MKLKIDREIEALKKGRIWGLSASISMDLSIRIPLVVLFHLLTYTNTDLDTDVLVLSVLFCVGCLRLVLFVLVESRETIDESRETRGERRETIERREESASDSQSETQFV